MFRFLGMLVVLGTAFGLGYYVGQHRIEDVRDAVANLSRHAMDNALGMGTEQNLRWRGQLIEAKARVVQAKSDLMDRNFGDASRELADALDSVQAARRTERDPGRVQEARAVEGKVRDTKVRLAAGKTVPRSRLDEIQRDLDALLTR